MVPRRGPAPVRQPVRLLAQQKGQEPRLGVDGAAHAEEADVGLARRKVRGPGVAGLAVVGRGWIGVWKVGEGEGEDFVAYFAGEDGE